jgi:hypothetical protein
MSTYFIVVSAVTFVILLSITLYSSFGYFKHMRFKKTYEKLSLALKKDLIYLNKNEKFKKITSGNNSLGYITNYVIVFSNLNNVDENDIKDIFNLIYCDLFGQSSALPLIQKSTKLLLEKEFNFVAGAKEGSHAAKIHKSSNSYSSYWQNYIVFLYNNNK